MTLEVLKFNLWLSKQRPSPQDPVPSSGCGQGPWWAVYPYQGLRSIYGGHPFQTRATKAPVHLLFNLSSPGHPPSKPSLTILWAQACVFLVSVYLLVFALITFSLCVILSVNSTWP